MCAVTCQAAVRWCACMQLLPAHLTHRIRRPPHAGQPVADARSRASAVRAWWQSWVSPRTRGTRGSSAQSPQDTGMAARGKLAAENELAALASCLLAPDFSMYDAYGLWPSMRAQGDGGDRGGTGSHTRRAMPCAAVIRWALRSTSLGKGGGGGDTHMDLAC